MSKSVDEAKRQTLMEKLDELLTKDYGRLTIEKHGGALFVELTDKIKI